jgi:hypothetical protein
MKFKTREEYLVQAVELMRPLFESKDYKIPALHVTCGWPSSGGLGTKTKTIGQCWAPEASSDNKHQIFISPWLQANDETGPLSTLVHEVVHAVVGLPAKHGKLFKECATAVGLEGKMTSTHAGAELMEKIKQWELELGEYPHAKLDPAMRPTKKQSTRMFKCECLQCGFVVRTARKWLEQIGIPHCPKHGKMQSDYIPDGQEDEGLGGNDE